MKGNDFVYLHFNTKEMSNNSNYKEGQEIKFTIQNEIQLSENENYYILEDLNGQKQLLQTDLYIKYNFIIGQTIICRIDHINCAGKIFIEPEHPYYKEGETYMFTINTIIYSKNRLDEAVIKITFIDKIGNEASCKIESNKTDNFNVGDNLSCKVELIKKGKLYLSYLNSKNNIDFKTGKYYKFKIKTIKTLSDNFKYYILSDGMNKTHLLRYEYYKNHKFEIGKIIECTILKFSSEGYYILEPKHPYYKIDKEHEFNFIEEKKIQISKIINNYEITVKDIFNEVLTFTSNTSVLIGGNIPNKINCKVIGIKKGKALLSVIR